MTCFAHRVHRHALFFCVSRSLRFTKPPLLCLPRKIHETVMMTMSGGKGAEVGLGACGVEVDH